MEGKERKEERKGKEGRKGRKEEGIILTYFSREELT